jgi:LL-diaminopimelate aminotransferase
MVNTASRLQDIGEYYFSSKLREIELLNKAGHAVINLGIGSPDLPPHPTVIEALHTAAQQTHTHAYQSYKGSPVLREAMANWYKKWYQVIVDPQTEILPLMGSKEGIMHTCMAFLDQGDAALVPNPGYPTYTSAVKLSGGTVLGYLLEEKEDWHPDPEKLAQWVDDYNRQHSGRVKLLFLNYPHMPTGQVPDSRLMQALVSLAKEKDLLIVHDNPYSFVLNDQPASLFQFDAEKEVVIELNSLSKSHNMAGWRVGMLMASAEHINAVLRFKSNMDSGMFLPVQLAAAKALELDRDWFDSINKIYAERKIQACQLLDLLDCSYARDQVGMFVWARIPNHYESGFQLSDEVLAGAKVFITPGGIFGDAGNRFVRVSLCSKKEVLEEAIERIKASFGYEKN